MSGGVSGEKCEIGWRIDPERRQVTHAPTGLRFVYTWHASGPVIRVANVEVLKPQDPRLLARLIREAGAYVERH